MSHALTGEALERNRHLARTARERLDLKAALTTLIERYHGDAGCVGEGWENWIAESENHPSAAGLYHCPACDAAALLARIEGA